MTPRVMPTVPTTRLEKLEALWDWLLGEGPSDIDGFAVQEIGVKLGLLRIEPYDPTKHGRDAADEYGIEPGEDYYVRVKPDETA